LQAARIRRRLHRGTDLRQRERAMVEKGFAAAVNSVPCTLRFIN